MSQEAAYIDFDRQHIWHPYTQEKLSGENFLVQSAQAEFINVITKDGKEKQIIDGISSWWVNIHGHCHPYITQRIKEQLDKHEQVIFAGFTHQPAIDLVKKLLPLLPKSKDKILEKAFFSDNGSTAVEVALKMAVQFFYNQGKLDQHRFIAFKDSYHGDTVGTMSIGNTDVFHQAFKKILFPVDFVSSPSEQSLSEIEDLFKKNKYAGVIIEPLVQASGGMKFHSTDWLKELEKLCKQHEVFLIADEVFTGFGRTGDDFACKLAGITPDIICLSKGLTGGFLPMGLTISTQEIYSAFYCESRLKTFFHGHSYTGNSLSSIAALASLELYQQENRLDNVKRINSTMQNFLLNEKLQNLPKVKNVRILGAIAVVEFASNHDYSYLSDIGNKISKFFLERNILLRPLGNVLYFLPPYTISQKSLDYCLENILEFAYGL